MTVTEAASNTQLATELDVKKFYKKLLNKVERSPFDEGRVIRYDTDISDLDLPEIHADVRELIEKKIHHVAASDESMVVILAGDPGMGKTHLLNSFRDPQRKKDLNYVLVSNSNHWKADEFDRCLLNWMLEALLKPLDGESNKEGYACESLLSNKIRAIAYKALDEVIASPGMLRQYRSIKVKAFARRAASMLPWTKNSTIPYLAKHRNDDVFSLLDYRNFSKRICDRFLSQPTNPFHRYVMRMLLRLVFPQDREHVVHWLRGAKVHDSFLKKVGSEERLDRNSQYVDVIKILISMFTSDDYLDDTIEQAGHSQVFVFAFDQSEGRNELFDHEKDWMKFFAQVSELYNTLPNVFVIFTMTLSLRDQLHRRMEKQFQDRIVRERDFILQPLRPEERLALYRHRVQRWLGDDAPDIEAQLKECDRPFLPLPQEAVVKLGARRTLRDALLEFDRTFREEIGKVVTGPQHDYVYAYNAAAKKEESQSKFQYFDDHLESVQEVLWQGRELLAEKWRLQVADITHEELAGNVGQLRIEFLPDGATGPWLRIFLMSLPYQYKDKVATCIQAIAGRDKKRNLLWAIRPGGIDVDNPRPDQVTFKPQTPVSTETAFQALKVVLQNTEDYERMGQHAELAECVSEKIGQTYLGELLNLASEQLNKLVAAGEGNGQPAAASEEVNA